jgi:beta-glucanase (GH16 family)
MSVRSRSFPKLVATGLATGASAVAAVAFDASAASGTLLFREDFEGSRLSQARWNTCYWWGTSRGCTNHGTQELQWYRPGQVRLDSGVINLVAAKRTVVGSDGRSYRYVSGMINTGPPSFESPRSKFTFRYGRAVIRARTPAGRGLWPSFWLLPANRGAVPEIDVLEMFGHRPSTALMYLHYRDREGRLKRRGTEWTSRGLRSGWHKYAVNWRPGRLVWLIDGVRRFMVKGAPVPDTFMYPLLNLAVGGEGPGPPGPSTEFPSRFRIDYIKVRR